LEKIEMKKTLVALAAIASVTAYSQTTVSIIGNVDFAGARISGTQSGAKGNTFSTNQGTGTTSAIKFVASEDIGGGNKITGFYELDPRTWANDDYALTFNPTSNVSTAVSATATGMLRGEAYIQAEGGFGSIKLGAPNSSGFDAHAVTSPLGTGVGSGYAAASNTLTTTLVSTRYSRSLRYDSPVMNGLKASFTYAPGNDEAAFLGSTGTYTARWIPNARNVSEIGLNYSNGPLNAAVTNISTAYQDNVTGWYGATFGSTVVTSAAALATKATIGGLNYNLGNTTLYVGMGSGGSRATSTAATKSDYSRFAVKHSMGPVDLIAQYTRQANTTVSTGAKVQANVQGMRADYNLSKTSAVYFGYEKFDTGTVAATTNTTSGTRTITSVGLRKSF